MKDRLTAQSPHTAAASKSRSSTDEPAPSSYRVTHRSSASGSAADLASVAASATDGLPDGPTLRKATTAVKAAAKRAETPSKVEHAGRAMAQVDKTAADTARYEALAREHGADLSEGGFNKALRKVARGGRE